MSRKTGSRPVSSHSPEPRLRRRLRWTTLIWVAPVVFIAARVVGQIVSLANASSAPASAELAPPFQVKTLDGNLVSDDQLRGKVVLINFWATWCPPCRAEMPGFESVYERHADSDFIVLGIAMDEGGTDGVRQFLADRHITYPVAMANGSTVQNFGGVSLLPSSFLIDRRGRIRNQVQGVYDASTLERQVEELLKEPRAVAESGSHD